MLYVSYTSIIKKLQKLMKSENVVLQVILSLSEHLSLLEGFNPFLWNYRAYRIYFVTCEILVYKW